MKHSLGKSALYAYFWPAPKCSLKDWLLYATLGSYWKPVFPPTRNARVSLLANPAQTNGIFKIIEWMVVQRQNISKSAVPKLKPSKCNSILKCNSLQLLCRHETLRNFSFCIFRHLTCLKTSKLEVNSANRAPNNLKSSCSSLITPTLHSGLDLVLAIRTLHNEKQNKTCMHDPPSFQYASSSLSWYRKQNTFQLVSNGGWWWTTCILRFSECVLPQSLPWNHRRGCETKQKGRIGSSEREIDLQSETTSFSRTRLGPSRGTNKLPRRKSPSLDANLVRLNSECSFDVHTPSLFKTMRCSRHS